MLAMAALLATGECAFSQDLAAEQKGSAAGELRFVQGNFTNFTRVPFLPTTNKTETVIQSFKVRDHLIGTYGGITFTGVRFTLPEWLDGDLHWSFFHLNPESQRRQRVNLAWGIVPERGDDLPQRMRRIDPDDSLEFWKRYPFTRRVYAHSVARTNLQAGASYAFYFAHFDPVVPDVAFAITIDSERGRKEFGSLSYISGLEGIAGTAAGSPLIPFIQRNWTNFPLLSLLPPTNKTETAFQRFKVGEHVIGEFEGRSYAGVRFTVPQWMDGDFEYAFVHLYRSLEEWRRRPGYSWGVMGERAEISRMENVERVFFKDLPETQARFPHTEKGYTGAVRREKFVPGKTYVFWQAHWWGQNQSAVPDLALAFTIVSERGRREFGEITWR